MSVHGNLSSKIVIFNEVIPLNFLLLQDIQAYNRNDTEDLLQKPRRPDCPRVTLLEIRIYGRYSCAATLRGLRIIFIIHHPHAYPASQSLCHGRCMGLQHVALC